MGRWIGCGKDNVRQDIAWEACSVSYPDDCTSTIGAYQDSKGTSVGNGEERKEHPDRTQKNSTRRREPRFRFFCLYLPDMLENECKWSDT